MYEIKRTDYGLHLVFGEAVDGDEARRWLEDLRVELDRVKRPFGVFVDMRTLVPLSDEARVPMNEGQKLAREMGMNRSVVILKDNLTILQFIKIAVESGINKTERYISAIDNEDWERQGLAWVIEGKEPAG